MITLGATDYTTSPAVLVHEMAHQWYGDEITPNDWRDVWMNEGMAMYLQGIWQADQDGRTADEVMDEYASFEGAMRASAGPPGDYDPTQFGDGNVYYGPALMWHELRKQIGDDLFFQVVRDWPALDPDSNAGRDDYLPWLVEHTGVDRAFFDELAARARPPPHGHSCCPLNLLPSLGRTCEVGGMRLLVLGGTVFLSRAVAAEAVRRGHEVTCAAGARRARCPRGRELVEVDRTSRCLTSARSTPWSTSPGSRRGCGTPWRHTWTRTGSSSRPSTSTPTTRRPAGRRRTLPLVDAIEEDVDLKEDAGGLRADEGGLRADRARRRGRRRW